MKRLLVSMFVVSFLLYSCSVIDDDYRMRSEETKDFSATQVEEIKIETENGRIESSVWEDDLIHVVFKKWATGDSTVEARENLDDIKILIGNASGRIEIDVDMPSSVWTDYGCDVFVNLPSSVSLDFQTSNGTIEIAGSQNGLECSTSNGDLITEDTSGNAKLRTSNGKITMKNHNGEVDGKTSNGNANADMVLPDRGMCVLKTSNGSITLSIPDTTSATIEASTSNGKVRVSDLDIDIIDREDTELSGKIGAGAGSIELETSNGDILIKKR